MLNILSHGHVAHTRMHLSSMGMSKCGGAYWCVLPTLRFGIDCTHRIDGENFSTSLLTFVIGFAVWLTIFVVVGVVHDIVVARFYCRNIFSAFSIWCSAWQNGRNAFPPYRRIQAKTNETLAKCKMASTHFVRETVKTTHFVREKRIDGNNAKRKTRNRQKIGRKSGRNESVDWSVNERQKTNTTHTYTHICAHVWLQFCTDEMCSIMPFICFFDFPPFPSSARPLIACSFSPTRYPMCNFTRLFWVVCFSFRWSRDYLSSFCVLFLFLL